MLHFRILGPLEVADGRRVIALGGPRQRATLAILLLNANRVVSVERLADDLYAGAPPVTAVTQVQRQISDLRKALGDEAGVETRAPGYLLRIGPEQLDLTRFERAAEEAAEALQRGEARRAAELLREALDLWRGAPLADLAYESFAQGAVARLEEIRLAALELRIDAELELGRHAALVPELETLVREDPLRERLRAQHMLALYRSGRQAEALEAYRAARAALLDGFGLEPGSALRDLERAMLAHDRALEPARRPAAEPERTILLLSSAPDALPALAAVAVPLTRRGGRALVAAQLLGDVGGVEPAAAALAGWRSTLDVAVRTAAFTTTDAASDAARLATVNDAELVLLDAPPELDAPRVPAWPAEVFERSPADVAVAAGPAADWRRGDGVRVPFGGGEHEWAALELGAQLAAVTGARLRLVGRKGRPGQPDASRLLADASLAVQRIVGIDVEPRLTDRGEDALVAAVADATVVVAGISPRWRDDGIGDVRRALLRRSGAPLLLVHRGPRPGVLAPQGTRTRFSWSVAP